MQSVIELGLMIWKILKTTKFHYRADGKFPYISLEHKKSYSLTTEEHDKQATRYLYMILLPLFICYLVYSLIYEDHKGWYSFLLSSCVGFIYIFGILFISLLSNNNKYLIRLYKYDSIVIYKL